MTRPPCLRLCPASPGNPRDNIEGESPLQRKGHTFFIADSAAAGTEYSRIHSRIVASSEVATWARLSARAAEPSTVSVRPQSATPKRARFHGLAPKPEAEARAGMGQSFPILRLSQQSRARFTFVDRPL